MPSRILTPSDQNTSGDIQSPGAKVWAEFFEARRELLRTWAAVLGSGPQAIHRDEMNITISGISQMFDLFHG